MLDTPTKRRIDTCRDILVGKVPDPKSQVEQITLALIYKFMDDMDAESEELGGRRTFFAGEFARYGWARLMSPATGGQEMLNLYAEGIARMNENPGIPALFRDIFKNAYLPYRDPETLRAFLKEINSFTYDHSERLGDAFEYLLSVLGSQGDAGQFRTPRHIIDFIVAVVDPQKTEKILDPACGTAGFLISAYKHILQANHDSGLTGDERARLVGQFTGYDISPDMVRLSLVNLYLHGFPLPQIFEYDTLTSDDRWNEYADVILANPPFMSPKGGIRPHTRFGVQSSRSEVLFVDYIAEHLTPRGRAGIIVPEGVIFQSGTAYKKLREMLVKNSLVAVVSLPAGVFQPYAGVKTSVLILDRRLARASDKVLFVKIASDGFGLGAQRRPVAQNDLPDALRLLHAWRDYLRHGTPFEAGGTVSAQVVEKEKIAASGDYNLSGERYSILSGSSSNFELVPLGTVCRLIGGGTPSKSEPDFWTNGNIKWISSKHIDGLGNIIGHELITEKAVRETATGIAPKGSVILISRVSVGKYAYAAEDYAINQDLTAVIPNDASVLQPHFLLAVSRRLAKVIEQNAQGVGVRGVTREFLSKLEIPLPPLSVQQEIVAEIESYQKIIDGARQVVENYKPRIDVRPEWPVVALGSVCNAILSGPFGSSLHHIDYVNDAIPVINPQNIVDGAIIKDANKTVSVATRDRLKEFALRENDIVIGRRGEMGRCGVVTAEMNGWLCGTGSFVIRLNTFCDVRFVYHQITSEKVRSYLEGQAVGVTLKNLNQSILARTCIPLPDLPTQRAIVAEIEAEQRLVDANRELVTRFEAKIKAVIGRVWGEDVADADNIGEAPPPQ